MFGASCHVGTSKSQASAFSGLRGWGWRADFWWKNNSKLEEFNKSHDWWVWFFVVQTQESTLHVGGWLNACNRDIHVGIYTSSKHFDGRWCLSTFNEVVGRLTWSERAPRKHDPWITSIVTCSKPHQDVPVIGCYPVSEWPRICWIVALKLSWHVGILNYPKASEVWGDELFLYPGQIYHNLHRTYDLKLYFIHAGTSKNVLNSDWWITELPWFKMLYFWGKP